MIKAIETNYNGYRFRSRLEARYAVMFDALGIQYEYESEGFEGNYFSDDEEKKFYYLPDFWLPDLSLWIEIKPDTPDQETKNKLMAFCIKKWQPLACLIGTPDVARWTNGVTMVPLSVKNDSLLFVSPVSHFCISDKLVTASISSSIEAPIFIYQSDDKGCFSEHTAQLSYHPFSLFWNKEKNWVLEQYTEAFNDLWETVDTACAAARSARFEHGEKPR